MSEYRATISFTLGYRDVRYKEILPSDFDTQEVIQDLLNAGYIEEYDGSLEITENGIYDVEDYETADVNVSSGGDKNANFTTDIVETTDSDQGTNNRAYQYIKEVPNIDLSNSTTTRNLFYNCRNLEKIDGISNSSNITSCQRMFYYCKKLKEVLSFNTSNVTSMASMFNGCEELEIAPQFNTSNVLYFDDMFYDCHKLKHIPLYDTSSATSLNGMFALYSSTLQGPYLLDDESLDNILQMCINAVNYTNNKSLWAVGIRSEKHIAKSRIQALPHYQDFINAGWTIGY